MQGIIAKGSEHGSVRAAMPPIRRSVTPNNNSPFLPSGEFPLQTTLANAISCRGIALHSGLEVNLTLSPAAENTGIRFQRTDCTGSLPFPALYDRIIDTRLSTVVASPEDPTVRVATIEHLMAALHALAIDNVLVSVDGPELPVLDGSSEAFAFLIKCAGVTTLDAPRKIIEIMRPVRVEYPNGAFAELCPSRQGLSLAVSIDFDAEAIGHQQYAMILDEKHFLNEISCCRTFVCKKDIEALQQIGLARGGSLENAIVVDGAEILNPAGLKVTDEFVRHKILDAVGDLYCSGHRLQAKFVGHKSGHEINNQLLRAVFADQANWRFVGTATIQRSRQARRARVAA